jgi:hypothetical protein
MLATNVVGGVGIFLSVLGLSQSSESLLAWGCALAVGVSGLLSFVRHSIFHRSDAARMGWDLGRRNNFQIEVGLANLAWGGVALAAALAGWGVAAMAATFLTMGGYLLAVTAMQLFAPGEQPGDRRPVQGLAGIGIFGLWLFIIGCWAIATA